MITTIEDYFSIGCGRCARFDTPACSTRIWADGLRDLRAICRAAGLVETVKWGHPCYVQGARNVAIIGAFRADFRLTFFNAALMTDPAGVLEKQGPNSRHPGVIRFSRNGQVAELEPVILSYLAKAAGYAKAGLKPPEDAIDIAFPVELTKALDADPDLADAFWGLTKGRQKSYGIHLATAKTSATRTARMAKCRDKILAGKGAFER